MGAGGRGTPWTAPTTRRPGPAAGAARRPLARRPPLPEAHPRRVGARRVRSPALQGAGRPLAGALQRLLLVLTRPLVVAVLGCAAGGLQPRTGEIGGLGSRTGQKRRQHTGQAASPGRQSALFVSLLHVLTRRRAAMAAAFAAAAAGSTAGWGASPASPSAVAGCWGSSAGAGASGAPPSPPASAGGTSSGAACCSGCCCSASAMACDGHGWCTGGGASRPSQQASRPHAEQGNRSRFPALGALFGSLRSRRTTVPAPPSRACPPLRRP